MAESNPDWVTARFLDLAEKQGGITARQTALEHQYERGRLDMRDGLQRIGDDVRTQVGHVRGEVVRLEDMLTKDRSELRKLIESTLVNVQEQVDEQIKRADEAREATAAKQAKNHQLLMWAALALMVGVSKLLDFVLPQLMGG
jgi:hypothetical protein